MEVRPLFGDFFSLEHRRQSPTLWNIATLQNCFCATLSNLLNVLVVVDNHVKGWIWLWMIDYGRIVNSMPVMTKIAVSGANGPDLGRGSPLPGEAGRAQDGRGPGEIHAILFLLKRLEKYFSILYPLVGPASWWHPATAGSLATSGAVSRQATRSSQRKRRPPTVAQVILITIFIIIIIRESHHQRNGCSGLHIHPLFFYLSWASSFLGFHLVEPAVCLWY